MQVHTFQLNEKGDSKLIVSVHNVQPVLQKTPALIHVPGGGFMFCSESDTVNIGAKFTAKGVGVICTYLYPVGRAYRFPQVVIDMMKCIRIVREHADEWGLDPKKIIISGNSAGAFICMSTGNLWNRPDLMEAAGCKGEEGRPDVMVLGFGPMFCGQQTDDAKLTYVPNGELVGEQTPPAFFHHARLDTLVSVYQAIAMIDAMERNKRPFGCFISGFGGHGSTGGNARLVDMDGTVGPCIDDWFEPCWRVLQNQLGLQQLPQPMPPMFAMGGDAPEGERPAMPPMMAPPPIIPEGSVPVTPADMPLGQADHIHMPFNAGFMDKDFTTYE